jgi:hypothetical protein
MAEKKEEVVIEKMSIYKKLFLVQQHLVAPKNQYNSFGKYKYRSCEDIFEGLKPVLSTVMAIVKVSDEIVLIGDRFYLKATAVFRDAETGETIEHVAYAREAENKAGMDVSQITGATSSYARKYALNGLFGIDDTKDADSMDNTKKDENKADKGNAKQTVEAQYVNDKIKPEQITLLSNMIVRKGFSVEKTYPNGIENINVERYEKDMGKLSKLPDKGE